MAMRLGKILSMLAKKIEEEEGVVLPVSRLLQFRLRWTIGPSATSIRTDKPLPLFFCSILLSKSLHDEKPADEFDHVGSCRPALSGIKRLAKRRHHRLRRRRRSARSARPRATWEKWIASPSAATLRPSGSGRRV